MADESLILSETHGQVALLRLNRPAQLNALNDNLMDALGAALKRADADDAVSCVVLTGSLKAFAAGADIAAMAPMSFSQTYSEGLITKNWETILGVRKPVIAAVAGYALGGGCELAMMCDIILAADNAKFGQPEIKLGIIPGAGGTQRLPRYVPKSAAMEMVLSGGIIDAAQAQAWGLVSRVVPADTLDSEALKLAEAISKMPRLALMAAKEAVNAAYETPLREGLRLERRLFHAMFATADQKEGMQAFLAKRAPEFQNR